MNPRRIATTIVTTGLLAVLWPAQPATAMTEEELRKLYLDVVELTVDVFEPIWNEDGDVPRGGRYDFRKYDTWGRPWYDNVITVPGTGQVIYCYSVLLNETDKEVFGERKLTREQMLERCIKSLRWCCLTSAYVEDPYPFHPVKDAHGFYEGKQWRRKLGYRADEVGWLTVAAARLWDKLDDETKKLVEQVMIGGAQPEWLVRSWRGGGQGGNHDVVKQDLSSTIGAAYLFPKRDDHDKYMDIIRGNGINLVATLHDQACKTKVEGKSVADWSAESVELYRKQSKRPDWRQVWNLYPDYSSDHHGWCQVWYGCDLIFEGRMYIEMLSHVYDKPVPEMYTYAGNGFDGVLDWVKTTCLPEGEPASIHGMEYDAYYGSGLLAYCYGSVIRKDPVAAALEERAAKLLTKHAHAVRLYDYHRNTYAKAATCYLLHKIHGGRAKPLSQDKAWEALAGNWHYRWQQALVHRSRNKWASWTWGTISARGGRMAGFIVPAHDGQPGEEPFIYTLENSLIGTRGVRWKGKAPAKFRPDVAYRHRCGDDGLSTAGTVTEPGLDRNYAFFAFNEGPCVLFTQFRARQACQMNFQGIPAFFYVRPKLTSGRTMWDATGTHPLETNATRNSNWWCVADRLGMATVGGSDVLRIKRVVGKNWARTEAYKDKADAIYTSTIDRTDVAADALAVDLVSAYYTETPHEKVAAASEALAQGVLDLPVGWKGAIVPDAECAGRRYLAVANFFGKEESAEVSLSFGEGAPILSTWTNVLGVSGGTTLSLEPLESHGEAIDLYLELPVGRSARAMRASGSRLLVQPAKEGAMTARLRYVSAAGKAYELKAQNAKVVRQDPATGVTELEIAGPACIDIVPVRQADRTAPAVEITDIRHRVDGQVEVAVMAEDASGIASVDLYCDGKKLPRQPAGEYVWVHMPGGGAHTFWAVATDNSDHHNKRTSFKRTITVHRDHARP